MKRSVLYLAVIMMLAVLAGCGALEEKGPTTTLPPLEEYDEEAADTAVIFGLYKRP